MARETPVQVELAKAAVEAYVSEGRIMDPPLPTPPELAGRAGTFVCLKRHGHLRGCIGTILPTTPDVAHEIIQNAVRAACADPRFSPVSPEELPELSYSVDVLSEPEAVLAPEDLDPGRFGCIVRAGDGRVGLLLPDLDGVDTVEKQVGICREKGGIAPEEPIQLERFTVTRYGAD